MTEDTEKAAAEAAEISTPVDTPAQPEAAQEAPAAAPAPQRKATMWDSLKTNPALEREGIRFEHSLGAVFQLRRAGGANRKFNAELQRVGRDYRQNIANGTLTEELAEELNMKAAAHACFVAWDGVEDPETGELMECTPANAERLLMAVPELWYGAESIRNVIFDQSRYRAEAAASEAAAKN